MKPPVFIVGSPRSGTTWLYHLLLSSGGFAIYRAETVVYTLLAPRFGGFRTQADRRRLLEAWLPSELFLRSGLDAGEFSATIQETCASPSDFLRLFMESIARTQGAERWAECTPDHLLHLRRIKAGFPAARFIHMVRDGRDVALSMAKQQWIKPFRWDRAREFVPAALYWEWAVRAGRDGGRLCGSDYTEVRYEELVERPRQTLAAVFRFIDHPFDYDRMQAIGIGSVTEPNTSFDAKTEAGTLASVGRWSASLSESESVLVEGLIGGTLVELGYQLANAGKLRHSPADRMNRQAYQARFRLRHLLKAHTPLGRWLVDTGVLARHPRGAEADRTLRPGAHRDFIRSIVGSADRNAGVRHEDW